MKKLILITLVLALFLAGCGSSSAPVETAATEPPTTEAPTEPTVSPAEKLTEARTLFYGTADQMPDRPAAVAILKELEPLDEPEVNYLLAMDAYLRTDCAAAKEYGEKAIEQKYYLACMMLGDMYREGTIATPRDVEKAEALFTQALDNGIPEGHCGIGDIYQVGEKGKIDLLKAAEEFRIAAEESTDPFWRGYALLSQGAVASTKYAEFTDFLSYTIHDDDPTAALNFYEQSAALWNASAINLLSYYYERGLGTEADHEAAVQWVNKLMDYTQKNDDTEAMYDIARRYQDGTILEKDEAEAAKWYEKAAALGHKKAINQIGILYYYGDTYEQDPQKEIEYYEKSAAAEYGTAMGNLGYSYLYGSSVEQDVETGLAWLEKAADHRDSGSMNALGNYYYSLGDYEKAEEWYIKGIDLQNVHCMLNLAKMYNFYNRVVAKEARLTEMSMYLGNPDATRRIGESFEKQIFYERDWNRAVEFYKQAVDEGSEEAKEDLRRLGITYP